MHKTIDKKFGERLAWLRKKKGLTQAEAAQLIGISSYQRYELGNYPNKSNFDILISFYKCSGYWLFSGEGEPYPGEKESLAVKEKITEYKSNSSEVEVVNRDDLFFQDIGYLKEIYASKDKVFITAIHANLFTFSRSVKREKEIFQLTEENQNLKNRLESLESRLALLEKSLSMGDRREETPPGAATGTEGI